MAKAPADQFYFRDYISDTRSLKLAARGAWMDIICHAFFKSPQGRISQSLEDWATMFGSDEATAKTVLDAIKKHDVGDVVTERNGDITVTNRRQFRAWEEKEANRIRQKKHREGSNNPTEEKLSRKNNGNVTALSSSSSSSASSSSISSSISESDFKRLILRVREENFPEMDERLVEIGILYTMIQRNGSTEPIKSTKYFCPEIKKVAKDSKGLSSDSIDILLKRRREQFWEQQQRE